MSQANDTSSIQEKVNKLEEEILRLEIENHDLQQTVKHCDFERYKLQEIQRLAKTGTWELNHLTYSLNISNELTQLLCNDPKDISEMSWHDFLALIVTTENRGIKQELIEGVIQKGKSLDFEHHLTRPDGKIIYVRHHCKSFYNYIGQPLITIGLIHDLTFEHNQSLELQKRSVTDELTQLYNRRCINNIIREQYDTFLRHKNTSSYIMLDIDHFKEINDLFGHQAGDEALQKIAKLIKGNTRKTDFAGRWGGEEFLLICPNTHLENAALLAEKLRKELGRLKISTNAMLKRIDDALYKAKADGRNKVVKSN